MRKRLKIYSFITGVVFLYQSFFPITLLALTGGPSQPEVQSFEPVGTSQMVDLATGDFNYNIPLLDVGGYPINIFYHSGITMDQEASWVGLGWNINPGVVNRSMRGIPDDFDGDPISREFNMKENYTVGGLPGMDNQLFGFKVGPFSLSASLGMTYNNYKGVGFELSIKPGLDAGAKSKTGLTAGLGLSASSEDGVGLTPQIGFRHDFSGQNRPDYETNIAIGGDFNSRTGVKELNLSGNVGLHQRTEGVKDLADGDHIFSANGGSKVSFSNPTYIPQIELPFMTESGTFSGTLGGELFGDHPDVALSGYYSKQYLFLTHKQFLGFGLFYSEDSKGNGNAILDFNREKEIPFTKNTPALPLTNFTYDVYSVSGQGIGGMYRPFRGDVGMVYDPTVENLSTADNLGVEIGAGNASHFGADFHVTNTTSKSGRWNYINDGDDNNNAGDLAFHFFGKSEKSAYPLYEPFYLKNAGEKTVDPEDLYSKLGQDKPVRLSIADLGSTAPTVGTMVTNTNNNDPDKYSPNGLSRNSRQRRNENISLLTADEASKIGLERTLKSYSGFGSDLSIDNTGRSSAYRKSKHISEITSTRSDGARYVYGIPTYNRTQKEVVFNAAGRSHNSSPGLVDYDPTKNDNSTQNKLGVDHYFSSNELPGYAYSYLLTAILSPDYVDVTGNGPTPDDLGTYTKFNYTKSVDDYKWRVPIEQNKANYEEGLKTDDQDDKANYIYGSKECWYLHSIESKNYIAFFSTSSREDGLGVTDENGGKYAVLGSKLMKLDNIKLYSYPDYLYSVEHQIDPTPIKSVYFEYNYDLCGGVNNGSPILSNNSGRHVNKAGDEVNQGDPADINANMGKLTLKKIYFTYGKSLKGKLNSYQFNYSVYDGSVSAPNYNLKGHDRWGNFSPNPVANGMITAEFPYVDQSIDNTGEPYANRYARAWNLTEIKLPSGGKISVQYESDDYGYVQDRPAMEMFQVSGIGTNPITDNPAAGTLNTLFTKTTHPFPQEPDYANHDYLYFKLKDQITSGTVQDAKNLVRDKYLKDILDGDKFLYFRFFISMDDHVGDKEYVPGYIHIDGTSYGVVTTGGLPYQYGYVKVKEVGISDRKNSTEMVNPIARAAWQYARLNVPKIAYGTHDIKDDGFEQVIKGLKGIVSSMDQFFRGFNRELRAKEYGENVELSKSFIRLYNPNKCKYGGGARVKLLAITDNWNRMTNQSDPSHSYAQKFEYKTTESVGGVTSEISSGVATYEPLLGGDENPFRQPVFFKEENILAPDKEHYLEEPFGECFFPSPNVVYSKVKVTNVNVDPNLNPISVSTNTGYTINEYYTAKDFPTITRSTGFMPVRHSPNKILSFLKLDNTENLTGTQGYVIELNDMAGKPKSEKVYKENDNEDANVVSGVVYDYQTEESNTHKLNNSVLVIDNKLNVKNGNCGIDVDFIADGRMGTTKTETVGGMGNLDVFLVGVLPLIVPMILPSYTSEEVRFHSLVTTKVINRYGILSKVTALENGASVTTENLAFDEETGIPLLTKTTNEFEDPIYSLTYPVHWIKDYDGMGPAYKNIGLEQSVDIANNGVAQVPNIANFLPGDELLLNLNSSGSQIAEKGWVLKVINPNQIVIVDQNGFPIIGHGTLKIVRSGRRNQQSLSAATFTSLINPITTLSNGSMIINPSVATKILNAGANEYSDKWQTFGGTAGMSSCNCPAYTYNDLTQAGRSLKDFLDQLLFDHVFYSPPSNELTVFHPVQNSSGDYYHGFTNELANAMDVYNQVSDIKYSCSKPYVNQGFPNDLELLTHYTVNPHGGWSCKIRLSASQSIDNITSISDFQSIASSSINGKCTSNYFKCIAHLSNSSTVDVTGHVECFPIVNKDCEDNPHLCLSEGALVNPFYKGIRGNWHLQKSYVYLTDRNSKSESQNQTDIRTDGTYKNFSPFWDYSTVSGLIRTDDTYWKYKTAITKIDPMGNELEEKDALGIYSSELFGYNHSLVTAVANNAVYTDIASDNFEDYDFADDISGCTKFGHWDFSNSLSANISLSPTEHHSGSHSLKVTANNNASVTRAITGTQTVTDGPYDYHIKYEDMAGRFSPQPSSSNFSGNYIISGWVKQAYPMNGFSIKVYANNASGTPIGTFNVAASAGPAIEGWKLVTGKFTFPSGSTNIIVKLESGASDAYFDDIRIYPEKANIKTYVYDPISLKLVAVLDENNYATFYEYDEEGALSHVKRETKTGIFTIQETRAGKPKF